MAVDSGVLDHNCYRGKVQWAKVYRKRLMEEKESMLEMKEKPRREYRGVQNVHIPSAFLNTWELCLGKSGIAPDQRLGKAWGWR